MPDTLESKIDTLTTRGMCLGYHRMIQAPATPII